MTTHGAIFTTGAHCINNLLNTVTVSYFFIMSSNYMSKYICNETLYYFKSKAFHSYNTKNFSLAKMRFCAKLACNSLNLLSPAGGAHVLQ